MVFRCHERIDRGCRIERFRNGGMLEERGVQYLSIIQEIVDHTYTKRGST